MRKTLIPQGECATVPLRAHAQEGSKALRTLAIATNTFREAIRRPVIVLILALLAVGVFSSQFVTFFGLGEEARMVRDTCLASITIGGLLVAVFASASVVSEEIDNRTVLTVLSKPVSRGQFIVGKYIGVLLTLLAAYGLLTAVFLFTVWCNESPSVQGLFEHWWRQVPISRGQLASWLGEEAGDPDQLASGWAVMGSLAGSAGLFAAKLVPDLLKALALSFGEVAILAAAAVAASTRLPTVINAVVSASFFVVGHIQGYVLAAWYPSDELGRRLTEVDALSLPALLWQHPGVGLARLVHAVLPDLESFNCSTQIGFELPKFDDIARAGVRAFDSPIPTGLLLETLLYGLLYSGILVALAVISFRRRELA